MLKKFLQNIGDKLSFLFYYRKINDSLDGIIKTSNDVNSTLERMKNSIDKTNEWYDQEIKKQKKRSKNLDEDRAYLIVDSLLLDIKGKNHISEKNYKEVDKLCEILKKYPDLVDNVMLHQPKEDFLSRALNKKIKEAYESGNPITIQKVAHFKDNMTEDGKEIKTLEDMLFYKSEIFGTDTYKKITAAIKRAP